MRKIIAIGECVYDILFEDKKPKESYPGGRIINAAASTAIAGIPTTVVSECADDFLGNIIVDFLASHGVGVNSVDKFTDGATAASIIYSDNGTFNRVKYGSYPNDRFDVVWPRIDEDDIIIFGSFYSVEPAARKHLFEMVTYAVERKAIIIYLPGFHRDLNYQITKVTTAILENLEVSNIVIANRADMKNIFDIDNPTAAFKNKVEFYCPNFLSIGSNKDLALFTNNTKLDFSNAGNADSTDLGWNAGLCAGLIYGLIANDVTLKNINSLEASVWAQIIDEAYSFAEDASKKANKNCISSEFGTNKKATLEAKI